MTNIDCKPVAINKLELSIREIKRLQTSPLCGRTRQMTHERTFAYGKNAQTQPFRIHLKKSQSQSKNLKTTRHVLENPTQFQNRRAIVMCNRPQIG